MMNLSVDLFERVRLPLVGLPHGVTGWRPPDVRPSPPPCGWSTGFMTTPRLCGRLPRQTSTTGLAVVDVAVIRVGDRADRGQAGARYEALFARVQAKDSHALVTADELDEGACRTGDLAALARLHLDVVDDRADRDVLQRHRVARLDVDGLLRGDDLVAGSKTLRSEDVGLFAVGIADTER